MYEKIAVKDITSCSIKYKIGVCIYQSPFAKADAEPYFKYLIDHSCTGIPSEKFFYYASLLHYKENYIEAINFYNEYLEAYEGNSSVPVFNDARLRIEQCENAINLTNNVIAGNTVSSQVMEIPINTSYDEKSPIISKLDNFLIFSSKRQRDSFNYVYGDQYRFLPEKLQSGDDDIYLSYRKGIQFHHPYPQFNEEYRDIYPLYIQDGAYMLLYIEYPTDPEGKGNIYETRVKKGRWLKPKKLNEKINSDYNERGAFLANNGTTIFFSSDRPGGQGGFDLYKSIKIGKDDWSNPINLGPTINSEYDEVFPFIHNDNKTLYYSTNGTKSIGGFDLVTSVKEGATWSTPKNLGVTINSPFDELQFSQIPSKRYSYFSSNRQNKDAIGGYDIYSIFKPVHKMKRAIVTGNIEVEKNGQKIPISLTVKDQDNITYKKYVYDPDPATGKFFMILLPGKNYTITVTYNELELYNIKIDLPKNTYRYQLIKTFEMKDIVVLNKTVGYDIIPNDSQFEVTTFDQIKDKKEDIADARYDALLMLMDMIVDRTDKDGLASLNALDDPALDPVISQQAEGSPDPYYTPLLDLIERAFNEANPDLLTTLDSMRGDTGEKVVRLSKSNKSILDQRYYFVENEFDISREDQKTLNDIASFIKPRSDLRLEIIHFSKSDDNNEIKETDTLTQMRINSINNYLASKGVEQWKIKVVEKPKMSSDDTGCLKLSIIIK
ncbi:PD40 domain-containing protein [Flammeovirga aprica]|uniref:OmpA-like domain-containing protein n=1 Tax=Flammeovirga aprica JL-4 TaxID=694437 RepID=A0A7X9RVJ9_9BACT|nr:PD40 domain-containing protein [Flammeovirga aprica]NME69527.1 hypothetical protein [Flammeovirga aprica JL-4]